MLANIIYQNILPNVFAACVDLHRRTQPAGIALNPEAPDILVQLQTHGYFEYVSPTYDLAVQKLGIIYRDGDLAKHEILAKDVFEIEEYQTVLVDAICESAQRYIEKELNAAGMILVDRMTRTPTPNTKALAVEAWVNGVYQEAEYRKALVWAGQWPDNQNPTDFTSFGKKPYTVAQLMAEA